MKKKLPFELGEYRGRVSRVREEMGKAGVDLFLVTFPANINYLTGFNTTGFYVFHALLLPLEGEPVMVVRELEAPNVEALTWIEKCVPVFDTEDTVSRTAEVIREMGFEAKRIGFEEDCWYLTPKKLNVIQKNLPQAKFQNLDGKIESLRVIKSPQEIEYIRKSARAASHAAALGLAAIKEGRSENDVAAEVYRGLLQKGSTYPSSQPYVVAGPRSSLPHATFEDNVINRGDVVFLEIGGCFHRYGGSIMRTGTAGHPPEIVKKMADASIAGLTAGIEAIKPGVTAGEVDAKCRGTIRKMGMGDRFHHRTGYSIGVAFPQGWGEGYIMDIKPDDPRELKAGMTFHLVPALFEPGVACVGFSETVVVTEKGAEILTECKRELRINL